MPAVATPPPAAPVGSAPALPKAEITPKGDTSAPIAVQPPKEGSARGRMFEDMGKYIKPGSSLPETPPEPALSEHRPPPVAEETPAPDPGAKVEDAAPQGDAAPAPKQDERPGKPAKTNPWKLVDSWKQKYAEAEAKIVELQKGASPPIDVEAVTNRVKELEQRAQAAEEELRFTNYQKHPEFKQKYEAPYEQAWQKAARELKGIAVRDMATGNERPFRVDDIVALTQVELGPARKLAVEMFGDFADDAMAHRKEIVNLYEAKEGALKEAREKGGERDKIRQQQIQAFQQGINQQIANLWETTNKTTLEDKTYSEFFAPVEGDNEINERLKKGFEIVDAAYAVDPKNPRLTPEQRAKAVKAHAALRFRAASWGRLVLEKRRLTSKVAELQGKLDEFTKAQPTTGGGKQAASGAQPSANARDQWGAKLAKLAH